MQELKVRITNIYGINIFEVIILVNNVYRLSSFAKTNGGGNPAGVVLKADNLREEDMKRIAAEVGYSETAFVMKSDIADYKVRFFTPNEEVDLCGHATIATFNLLREMVVITKDEYIQETKAGVLKLRVLDNEVYMEQNPPKFGELVLNEDIEPCFDSDEHYIESNLPIQVVSTGVREIFLPVKNLSLLQNLKPNNEFIVDISKKYNVTGIHAFTLDTIRGSSAHTRNFAPIVGIVEESATGTANGALASYLYKYIPNNGTSFIMEQGYCMNKPSEIKVELKVVGKEILEVYVGGNATIIKE